jgi:hypothetical protein
MRGRCFFLHAAFLSIIFFYGCTIYQKPRPFFEVPFRDRAQSKVDGEVKVTLTVLSAEESRQLFGVNLAGKNIQPVWVRVQNADSVPYWLMSAGLDPDYFSPLEAAYAFHGTIGSSVNKIMDDHFTVMNFRNPIAPGASVSGFIFANRDEGTKVVDIDLISYGKAKFFTFFVPIPGIEADYHEVDFDNLYPDEEIVHLDENELRKALENLPCCATNEDGTKNGDPLNLVFIGSRADISAAFVRRGWLPAEQTHDSNKILLARNPAILSINVTICGRGSVRCVFRAKRFGSVKLAGISAYDLHSKPGHLLPTKLTLMSTKPCMPFWRILSILSRFRN